MRVGVCSAPALGHTWWAVRGGGAFADGTPIGVSKVSKIEDAQLCYSDFKWWEEFGLGAEFDALAKRVVAHPRLRRLLEPHPRRRRRGRHRGGADRRALGPRAVARDRRGGGRPLHRPRREQHRGRRERGRDQRAPARRSPRGARSPAQPSCLGRPASWRTSEITVGHRHRHELGQGDRGGRGRQRRRVVAHPARHPDPRAGPVPARRQGRVARRPGRGARRARARRRRPSAVSVSAMVPSITAVDADGVPADAGPAVRRRARALRRDAARTRPRAASSSRSSRWTQRAVSRRRRATGPRPRSRTTRSSGEAVLDTSTASTAFPLFDWTEAGIRRSRRPLGVTRRAAAAPRPDGVRVRPDRRRRRPGARVGVHRRARRPDRRGRGQRRRRPRAARHDAHRELGDDAHEPVPGLLGDPAHREGQVPRRRPEQRGRAVRELGDVVAARRSAPDETARPGRVPVWAPYPRGERVPLHDPDRRGVLVGSRPHPRRAGAAARRVRGVRASSPGARSTRRAPRTASRRGGSSRPAGAPASTSGCRPSPTAPACPVECTAGPRGRGARLRVPGPLRGRARGRWAGGRRAAGPGRGRTVEPDPAWVEADGAPISAVPRTLPHRM